MRVLAASTALWMGHPWLKPCATGAGGVAEGDLRCWLQKERQDSCAGTGRKKKLLAVTAAVDGARAVEALLRAQNRRQLRLSRVAIKDANVSEV